MADNTCSLPLTECQHQFHQQHGQTQRCRHLRIRHAAVRVAGQQLHHQHLPHLRPPRGPANAILLRVCCAPNKHCCLFVWTVCLVFVERCVPQHLLFLYFHYATDCIASEAVGHVFFPLFSRNSRLFSENSNVMNDDLATAPSTINLDPTVSHGIGRYVLVTCMVT